MLPNLYYEASIIPKSIKIKTRKLETKLKSTRVPNKQASKQKLAN